MHESTATPAARVPSLSRRHRRSAPLHRVPAVSGGRHRGQSHRGARGASAPRIVLRHLLPNVLSPVVVLASFSVAAVLLQKKALSFLCLGVQTPTPT